MNSGDGAWVVETKKRIREAFQLFDKDRKGCVVQEEVATIMRSLGVYVTEKALVREILPQIAEETYVKYEIFEPKMLEMIAEREWEPDTEETMLAAFRYFDPDKKGYVEAGRLREILISQGTPFREKEIDAFMSVARDDLTGRIYYEDYVALVA